MNLDLFAGPGGWDEGARDAGIDTLGVELDADACATREAAGHRTLRADVTALDPADFAPCEGLIASPPCTAFSNAGDREGLLDVPLVYEMIARLARGEDARTELRARCAHATSLLVAEPLRFALALRPTWIALEQVPPVLDLWRVIADVLRAKGWSAWTGVLNAADYGVPQIRRRAILLAHRERPALPPEPTHAAPGAGLSLFNELPPWVTMADALGWSSGVTVNTGRDWKEGGSRADAQVVSADDPAPTLDGKGRWHVGFPRFGHDAARWTWTPPDEHGRERETEPRDPEWPTKRPATTVAGDPRIAQPGHKNESASPDSPGRMEGAIRVTLEEAATLQGFPAGYPWKGNKSACFRQVGNAVPPPLARAILATLVQPT